MEQQVALTIEGWEAAEACVWPHGLDAECGARVRAMWTEQSLRAEPLPTQAVNGPCGESVQLHVVPQPVNGPCGVLAAFQAHTFRHILRPLDAGSSTVTTVAPRRALATMLWQAATEDPIVVPNPEAACAAAESGAGAGATLRFVSKVRADRRFQPAASSFVTELRGITSEAHAVAAVEASKCDPEGWNAAALVFSLVLTRGTDRVARELRGGTAFWPDGTDFTVDPIDSLISPADEQGPAGFCEQGLESLALWGFVANDSSAQPRGQWPPPRVGLLALPDVVAERLRAPEAPVWVALWGGHIKVMLLLDGGGGAAGTADSTVYFTDGLHLERAVTCLRLLPGSVGGAAEAAPPVPPAAGAPEPLPLAKEAGLAVAIAAFPAVVDIIAQRQQPGSEPAGSGRLLQVVCRPGTGEGAVLDLPPSRHDAGKQWYCRDCYLAHPQAFAYNAADSTMCKECGKPKAEAGSSHWVTEAAGAVPLPVLRAWDKDRAPAELRLIQTQWPGAAIAGSPSYHPHSSFGSDR